MTPGRALARALTAAIVGAVAWIGQAEATGGGTALGQPAAGATASTISTITAINALTGTTTGTAPASPVSVYPIADGQVASPQTQIAFRGVKPSQLSSVRVSGSASGAHAGKIMADSDGDGGSFLPSASFRPGETVTVNTGLDLVGAPNGTYRFRVAQPGAKIFFRRPQVAARTRGDVVSVKSRPDLHPAAIRMLVRKSAAGPGDIFVAPQFGPVQNGPMILDPRGRLVWFKPLAAPYIASDFRVQSYRGGSVLTWWQGFTNAGAGVGIDEIYSTHYGYVTSVRAANGLDADLHEFQLTPHNTALITSYYPVFWNASAVGGSSHQYVFDSVVQEIDIPTGLVLFQWDSLDHVPLRYSYAHVPKPRGPFDYFHVNSVDLDDDGNLVISSRNTWAVYKVRRSDGAVLWTLGGKHSSFRMGRGASFAYQHDARVRAPHDAYMTIFDDGAGPPDVHSESRGIELALNTSTRQARLVWQDALQRGLLANFEGNVQQLSDHDNFLGWGQQPYFAQFDSHGRVVLEGRFVDGTSSYRAYRFPWAGYPSPTILAVSAQRSAHRTSVYVSWNGATTVARWRVLAGSSSTRLAPVRTAPKSGFETMIAIRSTRYVQAEALDGSGRVLATSATTRVS